MCAGNEFVSSDRKIEEEVSAYLLLSTTTEAAKNGPWGGGPIQTRKY